MVEYKFVTVVEIGGGCGGGVVVRGEGRGGALVKGKGADAGVVVVVGGGGAVVRGGGCEGVVEDACGAATEGGMSEVEAGQSVTGDGRGAVVVGGDAVE